MKLEEIKKIIEDYCEDKKLDAVYLFGSAASDKLRKDSDIDIALVGKFDFMELLDMKADLEAKLKRSVDLIDFNRVDTSFQCEIISTGLMVYAKDSLFVEELEMKIFSMYLTLEEDRAVVFEEILKRGSVYTWKE